MSKPKPLHCSIRRISRVVNFVFEVIRRCFLFNSLLGHVPSSACFIVAQVAEDTGIVLGDENFWTSSMPQLWELLTNNETPSNVWKYAAVFRLSAKAASCLTHIFPTLAVKSNVSWKTVALCGPCVKIDETSIAELPAALVNFDVSRGWPRQDDIPDADLALLLQYIADRRSNNLRSSHMPGLFRMCVKSCDVTSDAAVVARCLAALRVSIESIFAYGESSSDSLAVEEAEQVAKYVAELWTLTLEKRGHAYFWGHLHQAAGVIFSRTIFDHSRRNAVIADCLNTVSCFTQTSWMFS